MAFSGKDLRAFQEMVNPDFLARNPQLQAFFRETGITADPMELANAERAAALAKERLVEAEARTQHFIKEYEERFGKYHG